MRKTGCDWEKLLHHITPFPRNKLFICGRLVGKQMFSIMQSNCSSKHIFTQCLMNIPDLTSTLGHRLYSHLNINTNFSVLIRNSTFILSRTEAVYNRHVMFSFKIPWIFSVWSETETFRGVLPLLRIIMNQFISQPFHDNCYSC